MPRTDITAPLIAVVEDEDHLAQGLIYNLESEGYRTHHEADGGAALAWLLAKENSPSAVLLDVMLPGRDGFSIVQELRAQGRYLPVLLLTARGRVEDIAAGFAAGADDYLAKPFDLDVLLARLAALLRRMHWQANPGIPVSQELEPASTSGSASDASRYELAGRIIDLDTLEIRSVERTVHLTLMEAELLRYLLERPGKVIPRKELLENVWRVREDTDTRAIDNFIVRLRRYLEPDPARPEHLVTVRGVGYRFLPQS